MVTRVSLKDGFQGALVGAVIGDCLGAPFEFNTRTKGIDMNKVVKKLNPSSNICKSSNTLMKYTDDTAMSLSVCGSLLHCNQFNAVHMATCFANEYENDMNRGYGSAIGEVFHQWNNGVITQENVFQPSLQQFDGSGSYGNGAAMRVAAVALFAKDRADCNEVAKNTSLLTHSNVNGINGAILQAEAVYNILHTEGEVVPVKLLSQLKETLSLLEKPTGKLLEKAEENELSKQDIMSRVLYFKGLVTDRKIYQDDHEKLYEYTKSEDFSYVNQLGIVEELLMMHDKNKEENDTECVIKQLGCDVTAQQAVPTALYCFLKNLNLGFEKTLYYAISIGGDTDTIGTMCGAMAGAYYGWTNIPTEWINICESTSKMKNYADSFYEKYSI